MVERLNEGVARHLEPAAQIVPHRNAELVAGLGETQKRIAAVATNLRKMGAEVEERADGLRIPGGQRLHGAELDSFGDHRIAMAFAVAALRADGETLIHGADAAGVSYPAFFEELQRVTE